MVSSELPEILGMSDRVMVMHEGRITGILEKDEADQKPFCRWHPIEAQRMSNMKLTAAPASEGSSFFANLRHKMPKDTGIFVVMLVIALTFEIAGWYVRDQSVPAQYQPAGADCAAGGDYRHHRRGRHPVIITTGIDLSSGSVIALAAVVAASLAQTSDSLSPMFPALVNLPAVIPICAGIGVGLLCGLTNGFW